MALKMGDFICFDVKWDFIGAKLDFTYEDLIDILNMMYSYQFLLQIYYKIELKLKK